MASDDRHRSRTMSFSMPPDDAKAIEEMAQARGWHKSRVVREAVRMYRRYWGARTEKPCELQSDPTIEGRRIGEKGGEE